MQQGKDAIAQAFYLAQLQACKGSCKCNVCKLLRNAADLQMAAMLNPGAGKTPGAAEALNLTKIPGLGAEQEAGEEE